MKFSTEYSDTSDVAYFLYFINNKTNYLELSEGCKRVFHHLRDNKTWGSYGKDGNQPRKEILIKDLSDLHICAILETQHRIKGTPTEWLLKIEQSYRKEKGIEVRE